MATPNLSLELIQATDTIRDSLLNKMNENFTKLDEAYKVLVDALLERTKKDTLMEAIESIQSLYNTEDATVVSNDMLDGKIAYGSEGKIVGTRTFYQGPRINMFTNEEATTAFSYLDTWGAAIDEEGTLVVWAKSKNSSFENIYFAEGSIGIGEKGLGWGAGLVGSHSYFPVYACTVNGLKEYDSINVTLEPYSYNDSYDTLYCRVTVQEGTN